MNLRRAVQAHRASSSLPKLSDARLYRIFGRVRDLVGEKIPKLRGTGLQLECPLIHAFRRRHPGWQGDRAVMHVGHLKGKVCVVRRVGCLSDEYLVGLFLHEFGHLAGGTSENAANRKVFDLFGIRIRYAGPLGLERVAGAVADLVLGR